MLSALLLKGFMYEWVLFPIIIFVSRATDVSLGTLRSVLSSKGKKKLVPFIGFFEVLIWLFAISTILTHLSNFMCYIAWASGYATGIYIGLTIEERLAIGTQVIRLFTQQDPQPLIDALIKLNHSYTIMDGAGKKGPVKLFFIVAKRKDIPAVTDLIAELQPTAFYSIEDIKRAKGLNQHSTSAKHTKGFFRGLLPLNNQ